MNYHPLAHILRSSKPTVLRVERQPCKITGRQLTRLLKRGTATDRARLVLDIERGALVVVNYTRAQNARVARVSTSLTNKLARLSDAALRALARGETTLQAVRRDILPINKKLDNIAGKYGAEVLLAALDRATAPVALPPAK